MHRALALLLVLGASACSHVVLIKTTPPGAAVRLDGELLGVTPLFYEEATGFGREVELQLELEGYQRERLVLRQDQWWPACVVPSLCGIPFTLGLSAMGLLFARSLRDEYHFLLQPLPPRPAAPAPPAVPAPPASAPAAAPAASTATSP